MLHTFLQLVIEHRVTLVTLTKYFCNCRSQFILQKWSQKYDKLIASFTDQEVN